MLEPLRDALYRAITTPRGDSLPLLRVPKDLARRLNVTLGSPLATRQELAGRADARKRLRALRASKQTAAAPSKQEAAPLLVYFEKDRNVRDLERIEGLLAGQGLTWKRLDVTGDEATLDFVARQAGCKPDELPVVFVADRAVGGYASLARAEASGDLARWVYGTAAPTAPAASPPAPKAAASTLS